MKIEGYGNERVIRMEHDDKIQLLVPASVERTCVHLGVTREGKLMIVGGSSIIDSISGPGMKDKIKT